MHFTFLNWISEHPPRPINRRCANKLCAYGVLPILVGNHRGSLVILSEAKDLSRWATRCFAALSMTRPALVVTLQNRRCANKLCAYGWPDEFVKCHNYAPTNLPGVLERDRSLLPGRGEAADRRNACGWLLALAQFRHRSVRRAPPGWTCYARTVPFPPY